MALSARGRVGRQRARGDLASQSCELMNEYWFRPRELLVHPDDLELVKGELERWEARRVNQDQLGEEYPHLQRSRVPLAKFLLPPRMDVHAVVRRLREVATGPEPRVTANHVFGACQSADFGPGDNAAATEETRELGEPHDEGYVVAVLDSGLVMDRHRRGANPHRDAHERMLIDVNDPAADTDPLDVEPGDGMLDDADVHGGFIADLIRAESPEASVRVARVLLGGVADEAQIADGILRLHEKLRERGERMHVLNLSLGGYTDRNLEPWLIVEALRRLEPRPVVIAAAGNYGRRRPFWPAALKGVIGVGAVDSREQQDHPPRAAFSNHGPWVDACAPGVELLSTFVEFDEQLPAHLAGNPDEQAQTFSGWARWSGTSFAAPMVAARIVAKAMDSGIDRHDPASHDAVRRAAWELVWNQAPTHGPDLGVYVP